MLVQVLPKDSLEESFYVASSTLPVSCNAPLFVHVTLQMTAFTYDIEFLGLVHQLGWDKGRVGMLIRSRPYSLKVCTGLVLCRASAVEGIQKAGFTPSMGINFP